MNKKNLIIISAIFLFFIGGIVIYHYLIESDDVVIKELKMKDLSNMSIQEAEEYAKENEFQLEIKYEYSYDVEKDYVIRQSISTGNIVHHGDICDVVVSKGEIPVDVYSENQVNELGHVPIMMYHGIVNVASDSTGHTGGNVDKDGYNRTAEAFRGDLEFYYQNGYRMISLNDYVDGIVDVELGMSPIILTFDDGSENNFKVLGEEDGELLIDPNCAVGILEEFKRKYPDYGVTATFFVNSGLFGQEEYNEKILNWLVLHGYDVGNHTMNHSDFTKIDVEQANQEVGGLYHLLDTVLLERYVSIVALPFGSPYKETHQNFSIIMDSNYQGKNYHTKAALRVGWEAEYSCFDKEFNPKFLKRIRAYDNDGEDFDIQMNFKLLENNRYISDGDPNTIVILEKDKEKIENTNLRIRSY